MRGVILGGGTFLGYWIKNKIIQLGFERPIIVDLPRTNVSVYTNNKEIFFQLDKIDYSVIRNYNPGYFLLNYYDLFDAVSLMISNTENNIIMSVTNRLLDIAQELNSNIYVLTHINRYPSSTDAYRSSFNTLNDLYLQYIELISRAKSLRTKIVLLPNLFGPREPKNGVIPTIKRKITEQDALVLSRTERDFLYVDSVVEAVNNILFHDHAEVSKEYINYYALSSGKQTTLLEMYRIISSVLEKHTKYTLVDESYSLKQAEIGSCDLREILLPQDYHVAISEYC